MFLKARPGIDTELTGCYLPTRVAMSSRDVIGGTIGLGVTRICSGNPFKNDG
jgi:hypothetical protein